MAPADSDNFAAGLYAQVERTIEPSDGLLCDRDRHDEAQISPTRNDMVASSLVFGRLGDVIIELSFEHVCSPALADSAAGNGQQEQRLIQPVTNPFVESRAA